MRCWNLIKYSKANLPFAPEKDSRKRGEWKKAEKPEAEINMSSHANITTMNCEAAGFPWFSYSWIQFTHTTSTLHRKRCKLSWQIRPQRQKRTSFAFPVHNFLSIFFQRAFPICEVRRKTPPDRNEELLNVKAELTSIANRKQFPCCPKIRPGKHCNVIHSISALDCSSLWYNLYICWCFFSFLYSLLIRRWRHIMSRCGNWCFLNFHHGERCFCIRQWRYGVFTHWSFFTCSFGVFSCFITQLDGL